MVANGQLVQFYWQKASLITKEFLLEVSCKRAGQWGFLAALINFIVGEHGWRYVFYVGALPSLLTIFLRFKLKEPEKWLNDHKRRVELKKTKNYVTEEEKEYAHFTFILLFSKKYIRRTLVGLLLATLALFGVWGATYWIPAIIETLAKSSGVTDNYIKGRIFLTITLLNIGAILGALAFWPITNKLGRRGAFLFYFLIGLLIILPNISISSKLYIIFYN